MRQHFLRDTPNGDLSDLAASAQLPLALPLIQGEVDICPGNPLSFDQAPTEQMQQALPRLDVQSVVELAR